MHAFTYCKQYDMVYIWIDYVVVVCNKLANDKITEIRITEIRIHYDYRTSDNKPMSVKLSNICIEMCCSRKCRSSDTL